MHPGEEFTKFWNERVEVARKRQGTTTLTKISSGFYIWMHPDGTLFQMYLATKSDGFEVQEWHWGPEYDPAADQAPQLKQIREWIEGEMK